MKKLLIITLLFFLCNNTYSQDDFLCGTEPPIGESIDLNQYGGIYLTSQGTLKVLVVFVRFKDDTTYHPYWTSGWGSHRLYKLDRSRYANWFN